MLLSLSDISILFLNRSILFSVGEILSFKDFNKIVKSFEKAISFSSEKLILSMTFAEIIFDVICGRDTTHSNRLVKNFTSNFHFVTSF